MPHRLSSRRCGGIPSSVLGATLALALAAGCGGELRAGESESAESAELSYSGSHNASDESLRGSDGRIDGQVTEWHEDTGLRAGEGEYRNDRREGPWVFWYPDGELRLECSFRDGVQNGKERRYHPGGQLHQVGTMKNGRRNGEYRAWRPDGTKAWEGTFVDGEKNGTFTYWRSDGSIDEGASGKYANGVRVSD